MWKVLTAILCVLVASSNAASSCSASAALQRGSEEEWSDGIFNYTIYYLHVTNTGTCGLNSIQMQFTLPEGGIISEHWGLDLLENRIWELTDFGGLIDIGATYSSAGFTLQKSTEGIPSVIISNTLCNSCDSTGSPTSSPTSSPTNAPTRPPVDREFITQLITAPSQNDRLELLKDEQFVFDFKNSMEGETVSEGGRTVATSRSNFHAVIGNNIAMTVGFIEPCGINLPHTHPRATEINFIAKGRFQAGFFMENRARYIENVLETGMVTVFPQGAIHFEINLECEPAIFVAAFNNEDPGVQTTAQSFFGLPADVAGVSLNISSIQTVEDLAKHLPANPAVAMQQCMERCGFSKKK